MQTKMIFYIQTMALICIACNFYCLVLHQRTRIKHPLAASLALTLPVVTGTFFLTDETIMLSACFFILLPLPCLLFFQDRLSHRVFVYFTALFTAALSEVGVNVMLLIINIFLKEKLIMPTAMLAQNQYKPYFWYMFWVCIMTIIILHKLSDILKVQISQIVSSWILKFGSALAIALLLENLMFFLAKYQLFFWFLPFYVLGSVFCLFLLNTSISALEKQSKKKGQLERRKQLLEQQLEYYSHTGKEYEKIRKWNHDISNHLLALTCLIEQGSLKDAEQYTDFLLDTYETGGSTAHEIPD